MNFKPYSRWYRALHHFPFYVCCRFRNSFNRRGKQPLKIINLKGHLFHFCKDKGFKGTVVNWATWIYIDSVINSACVVYCTQISMTSSIKFCGNIFLLRNIDILHQTNEHILKLINK